ncbi:MAG: DUF393 domain-containing protein [Nitrospina sp.]|nr:MAG: DUF393 domain-containing protein [Nitrospina sp.]
MPPIEKPLLIYDGDCQLCTRLVRRGQHITKDRVDYAPFQETAPRFPEIAQARFEASVQLVLPSGEIFEGAEAVFRTLAMVPGRGRALRCYRKIPGFAWLSEVGYRWVSRNRKTISAWTRWL